MVAATPLYLDAKAVQSSLSDEEVYEIVSRTLRQLNSADVVNGPIAEFGISLDGDHLHMGSISACLLPSSAAGLKWFVLPGKNRVRSLPRVPATILICDAKTGLLDGVLDATQLTCDRTAAMAVAAAFACARRPLKNVAVIGAGHIGRGLVKFSAMTQSIDHITLGSLTESSARYACELVASSVPPNLILRATADICLAVRDADVVFTATSTPKNSDLVRARWLKDDAIVCSLGSRREVDIDLIASAWIVVDDPDGARMRSRNFREGGVGWGRIAGHVGSLMSGHLRLPEYQTKIYLYLGGLGVLDVALGVRALANSRRKGLGIPLEPSVL
ncbi:NAD(P)-binding domain-containing protein [Bradyrhizobium sp. USDA 4506]